MKLKRTYVGCTFLLFLLTGLQVKGQNAIKGEWNNVKIGGGGFVSSIITCPTEQNLFYARTDVGGAYRWNESGQKWIPLLDWVSESETALLGVESMAIDPGSPNKLYITAGLSGYGWPGASILKSEDYGETFEKIPMDIYIHGNGMGRQTGEKLVVDPNNGSILFLGTRKNGLLKSTDAAATWSEVASFPVTSTPSLNGISFILFDPNSAQPGEATQTLYAGCSITGENIFVSNDGGASWEPIPGAPTLHGIMPQRAVLSSDGEILFVTYANGAGPHPQTSGGVDEPMNKGAVYKYTIDTQEWTDISPIDLLVNPVNSGCYGGITIDIHDNNRIICSTLNYWSVQQFYTDGSSAYGDRLFISYDGGDTWTSLFDGKDGMLLDNNGINWISGHNLHWVGCVQLDPFDSERLMAISGNGIFMTNTLTSAQPKMKFTVNGLEETVPLDMISIPDGPFVSIVGDYDGWVHQDPEEYPAGPRLTPNMGTSTGIAYSNQNKDVLVRAGSSGKVLYYSLDQGQSWEGFVSLPENLLNGKVAISSDNDLHRVVWVPDADNKLYITDDWGASWTNIWNSSYGIIRNAHPYADPVDPTIFYIYSSLKGKIYTCLIPSDDRPEVNELVQVGSGGSPHLAMTPDKSEDFWVATGTAGLKHWSDGTLTIVDNISAEAVTLGKPFQDSDIPTLFVSGIYKDIKGLFRSTDMGTSWYRVNDDEHEYGGLGNAGMILGDNNKFGRVFMSTSGRGIAMGVSATDTLSVDQSEDPGEDPEVITGSENKKSDRGFVIYPNPFNTRSVLKSPGKSEVVGFDLTGKLICHKEFIDQLTIGSDWPAGFYYLRIRNKQGMNQTKLIKQ